MPIHNLSAMMRLSASHPAIALSSSPFHLPHNVPPANLPDSQIEAASPHSSNTPTDIKDDDDVSIITSFKHDTYEDRSRVATSHSGRPVGSSGCMQNTIKFLIGPPGPEQAFYVPQADTYLTDTSRYFRRVLANQTIKFVITDPSLPSGVVEPLLLRDVRPEVFHAYIDWVYGRKTPASSTKILQTDHEETYHGHVPHQLNLIHLYKLGEQLEDLTFTNVIIDMLMDHERTTGAFLDDEPVRVIMRLVSPENKLYLLACHQWAGLGSDELYKRRGQGKNAFMAHVAVHLACVLEQPANRCFSYEMHKCTFHNHDEELPECGD